MLYIESENELKFYNLEARSGFKLFAKFNSRQHWKAKNYVNLYWVWKNEAFSSSADFLSKTTFLKNSFRNTIRV